MFVQLERAVPHVDGFEHSFTSAHVPPVAGAEWHLDLRMFAPGVGVPEDPVTGSLNAVLAQWLIGAGHMPPSYLARQGTALGRDGRVHIETVDDRVWVGGDTVTAIEGVVRL